MTTTVPPPVFAPGSGGEGGDKNGHEVDAKLDAKLAEADLAFGGRDSKRGFALLAEALAACQDVDAARTVLNRAFQAALSQPTDAEAGVSLFVRAEERFGVRRDILEGRAQLHELAGHAQAAMATLQRIIALSDDDAHKALLWERIGDLARGPLSQPQQALIHFQSAFRLDRKNRRAAAA
jgi:tetratricopeptide (TPR) repeat protein